MWSRNSIGAIGPRQPCLRREPKRRVGRTESGVAAALDDLEEEAPPDGAMAAL
jgi:hypothetical protein